jgi:hypothetical protein
MNDDLLSRMTKALADEHDGATAVPEASRARVVRALAERRPRRRKWWSVGVPAFVLLGGSTAWASATGRLPVIVERAIATLTGSVPDADVAETPVARMKPHGTKSAKDPPLAATEQPQLHEKEAVAEEPALPVEELDRAPSAASNRTAAQVGLEAAQPKTTAPAPEDHSALLSYRTAHRAHFQEGNCGAAITGYRKYLREQPGGSFALEAQYNLALCLIRQGKNSEAVSLLRPFAEGQHGNYRKEKSQELIEQFGK